jgi:hypothetical protein
MPEHYPEDPATDLTVEAIQEVINTMGGDQTEAASAADPKQAPLPDTPDIVAVKKRLGIPIRLSEAPPHVRKSVIEDLSKLQQLGGEMPSQDEGLEIELERIGNFFASRGLTVRPVTILTAESHADYVKRLGKAGFTWPALSGLGVPDEYGVTPTAVYVPPLRRIIALRPPGELTPEQLFELNRDLAHEAAHSTAVEEEMVYKEDDARKSRRYAHPRHGAVYLLGQAAGKGTFSEEAYAELLTADYTRNELGMPEGIWPLVDRPVPLGIKPFGNVPAVYLQPGKEPGRASMTIGALAAHGMELIIEERPELRSALDESRRTVEGRRQVARIIESVKRGLYGDLLDLNQTSPYHFDAGLWVIKKALNR